MAAGRYRLVIAALLFAASVINYLDRTTLGVVAPQVSRDLGLTPSAMGVVFSIFFVGYTITSFLGGWLADRKGPRQVFSWTVGLWSLFCAATGLVVGFWQLIGVRALFGFAEGPVNSTTSRTIRNWFPRAETARTIGFTFSGQMVGSMIAGPTIGLLMAAYGWRVAFFATGILGVIWILAWRAFATDRPQDSAHVGAAENAIIAAGQAMPDDTPDDIPMTDYLLRASTLSLALAMFANNYIVFVSISWLPTYLSGTLHMGVREMALAAGIPYLFGFIGLNAGGALSDYAWRRLPDRVAARKTVAVPALALAGLSLIGVIYAPTAWSGVAAISLALLFISGALQTLWAITHEIIPGRHVGGVGGFIHMLSNISGIIGPVATGFAVQYFGGYDSAFAIMAGLVAAGAVAVLLFVRRPIVPVRVIPTGEAHA